MKIIVRTSLFLTLLGIAQAEVTFNKDIAPIVHGKCAECHRPGETAPFSLLTYSDARRRARTILEVVQDRYMPPWHAVGGDIPIVGDRRLTSEQIAMLEAWVDAEMPEGDPKDLPEPPQFNSEWKLGEPDLILTMDEAYSLPAEGPDIYRNFVLPSGLTKKRWLKAVEFKPGSPSVVHHSLFYLDTSGEARKVAAADPEPGFDEMPLGEGTGRFLGGWVPGASPIPLPEGLAFEIPAKSDIVLSTHFHLSGKEETEASTIGLYFTDKPAEKDFLGLQLPPAFGAFAGIIIPPGESDSTYTDTFELPVAIEAFGATAHSHYLGKSLKLEATLPDGEHIVLLNIPQWDFSWQEQYYFEDLVRLPAGTKLISTVTWDNSASNPNNPYSPPVTVEWGRESYDEMGSVTLFVTTPRPNQLATLRRAQREHLQWQASSHLLTPDKLSFVADLRSKAMARFDHDGDGQLNPQEREEARNYLKSKRSGSPSS